MGELNGDRHWKEGYRYRRKEKMEVTYIRKINASYLQIAEVEREIDNCAEQMQLRNQIYGLLPMNVVEVDEKRIYQYNITGRQALDVLLEHKLIDENILVSLLAAISGVAERLENYLLIQNGLLLTPEYIFRDYETGEFWFCYYPGKLPENEYTFQRFTEYLLTKIDHKEERVVRLAYQIYEEALKEGYSLVGMRNKLSFSREEEDLPEKEVDISNKAETESTDEEKAVSVKRTRSSFKKILAEVVRSRIKNVDGKFPKLGKIIQTLEKLYHSKQKKMELEPFVFEPEQEEVKQGNPTTLLLSKDGSPEGILKYIGNNQLPDFRIDDSPFLIGSDVSCGAMLEKVTISRIHARITKVENTYYIEDLNSSNGTRVGGVTLSYKEKTVLNSNEIVEFADERFRFI